MKKVTLSPYLFLTTALVLNFVTAAYATDHNCQIIDMNNGEQKTLIEESRVGNHFRVYRDKQTKEVVDTTLEGEGSESARSIGVYLDWYENHRDTIDMEEFNIAYVIQSLYGQEAMIVTIEEQPSRQNDASTRVVLPLLKDRSNPSSFRMLLTNGYLLRCQ